VPKSLDYLLSSTSFKGSLRSTYLEVITNLFYYFLSLLVYRLVNNASKPHATLFSRYHLKQTQFDAPHQELSIDTGLTSLAPKTSELFLFKHTLPPPLQTLHKAWHLRTSAIPRFPRFLRFPYYTEGH
jgi:hypothetical protein